MGKKTLKGWENSNVDLDKYLTHPCEIDEGLLLYIGECVAPFYVCQRFTQGGDCYEQDMMEDGSFVGYYMTVSTIGTSYFYLGILPEFKQ